MQSFKRDALHVLFFFFVCVLNNIMQFCHYDLYENLKASVAQWLCHSPCKPGMAGLSPDFSSLSDETTNRGPVSI